MISGYTETLGAMVMMAASLLGENPLYEITPSEVNVQETFCLAQNIWFEARNTSVEDQTLVGMATMNRVKDRRYSKTICEVVWEPDQFSWTDDGKPDRIDFENENDIKIWNEILRMSILMQVGYIEDESNGATHYHAHYVTPGWSKKKVLLASTDGHKYYRSINYTNFVENEPQNFDEDKNRRLTYIKTMLELYEYVAGLVVTSPDRNTGGAQVRIGKVNG